MAWIATVGVLPEHRGRGIGTLLMEACEEKLPYPAIRLCVRLSNEGAIRLYERLGYRGISQWGNYYQDGEAALVMEKRR
jgi:ribosomal-protein-alanine N-acetyltransferase